LTARKLVKKYLNSECFGSAGSSECGAFGKECSFHNGTHFINVGNNSIFEVINPKTLKHDTKGELVITALWRKGYPLIRYRTGDYIELDSLPCPCGYPSSRIKLGTFSKYKDFYSISGTKGITLIQFDELIRKYIGINNYFVKILNNQIIIKIEEGGLSKQKLKKMTQLFCKRFNTRVIIKIIKGADKITLDGWKFNRIYDARNGPNPSLFIKVISRITRILQSYLNKNGPLHPW
jgi:phenylacetate-coenzyme A ligase PaaK-like adenylate-forming protein